MDSQQEYTARNRPFTRIGIVDDHAVVRAGLQQLFSSLPGLRVVASASDGVEALAMVAAHELDVLVLDIAMPRESAVDILQRLRVLAPQLKVLVFSGYAEQQYALPMIRLGAVAYVDKAAPLDDLVQAVRTVMQGGTFFSQRVRRLLAEKEVSPQTGAQHPPMTTREFQIFLRLAAGETVTEIATALSLSDVTVSSCRSRLLEKLALKSNAHLTRYAIENGYLS